MQPRPISTPILLTLLAFLGAASAARAGEALRVAPPELKPVEHRLANGLQVLLLEDHSAPVADVQVWYHVGSKDEKKGRTGFAHLFEHLMFQGSANLPAGAHKTFLSSIGGRYNATTDADRTLYFETFPSQYLERVLWMEADRMRSLDVSEANFQSERAVVKEERRLRVDNPPFGRLREILLATSYTSHPYRIDTIGSMEDLDRATVEDVRAFHAIYYVPNDATLIVSGDFKPELTLGWIERYFGRIAKGSAVPRDIPAEPAQTRERRQTDYRSSTPLPAVAMTFHIPAARHPDMAALQIAGTILSDGQSFRLYRRLVYDKQIALFAGGTLQPAEDPGLFYFFAILQGGQAPSAGSAQLQAEVERLRSEPVSADELTKAKNQLVANLVLGRQTVDDKGAALGYANLILGDLTLANRQLAALQKVSAADVLRVAQTYFQPSGRTVVTFLPEAMRPASPTAPQGVKP